MRLRDRFGCPIVQSEECWENAETWMEIQDWRVLTDVQINSPKDGSNSDTWFNKYWLVVWNIFYFPLYWVANHPNWRTHIFQRGGPTTNQLRLSIKSKIYWPPRLHPPEQFAVLCRGRARTPWKMHPHGTDAVKRHSVGAVVQQYGAQKSSGLSWFSSFFESPIEKSISCYTEKVTFQPSFIFATPLKLSWAIVCEAPLHEFLAVICPFCPQWNWCLASALATQTPGILGL